MEDSESATSGELSTRQMLRHWLGSALGRSLLQEEQSKVSHALVDLFGYHIVQIGCLHEDAFINSSRISHKFILQLEEESSDGCRADVVSSADSLALASDSMDVVFLPHVLEYTVNPHRLLREVARVLIGDGHVVIIGFNPWSLWGLWRMFQAWREVAPWCGHFFGLARIKDWLSLLDFELVRIERFFFRPPIQHTGIMDRLKFLEKLGKYCWRWFGGSYIIIAKKRVIPLTPIKMQWRDRRSVINSGIAEPSTRMRESIYEKNS